MEQPCPQCGQYVADTEEFCPNPSCGTYLGWDRQGSGPSAPPDGRARSAPDRGAAPAAEPPGRPPESARDRPSPRTSHVASLSTQRLDVAPGETAELTVTVTNTGSLVDEVRVSVASPLAACTTVAPAAVQVYPGAQESVHVAVSPPHEDGPWAGSHPLVLDLASTRRAGDEQQRSQHQVTVVVGTRVGMTARLVPARTTGRGTRFRSDVEVANHGNTPMHVSLHPRDDYGRLRWGRQVAPVTVPPGAAGSVPLTTRSRTNWWGDPDPLPFEVTVRGAPAAGDQDDWEQRLEGLRDQQAALSGWRIWALVAAVLAVFLLLAAPVALGFLDGGGDVQVEADDSGQVTLPDLVGSEVSQATSELEDAGLQVSVVQDFSTEEAGTVLAQDPGAGTTVDAGTTVSLLVSQGEPPDAAVCEAVAEAREVLGEQGLTEDSASAAGEVVDAAAAEGVDGDLVALGGSVSSALDAQDGASLGAALDQMAAICGQ
jgi:hypothetical protein